MRIIKKNLIIIMLVIIIIGTMQGKTSAVVPIDTAYVYATRKTDTLLKCEGIDIYAHLAVYKKDGIEYPAYCLNRNLYGVEIGFSQNLSVRNLISDVSIWRVIINGYPYKSISELGCQTEEEAYLATKQAIYSTILGRDVENAYTPIGESGKRVLNAIIQIVNNAKNSNEVKASSELTINQVDSLWKVDEINNRYISQEFYITANAPIDTYNIELTEVDIEGIKITDINNNEKTEFSSNEKFKILLPITNIERNGNFSINAYGKVKTKPVFYGESDDPTLQNFALTGYTMEDGTGSQKIYYTKNDTKIIIIKKDETGKKFLEGVEFNLLDSNKNIIYTGLITDENGKIKINNLIPGKYYVEETRTKNGYELYDKLIEVNLELNETSTVNVINNVEQPKIEVEKPASESTVSQTYSEIAVKLPKTGY